MPFRQYFPIKTNKVRSTDDPWIFHEIRKKIKARKKIYKKIKKEANDGRK